MKTLFIPARSKLKLNKQEISKFKFPKNLAIFYSIQYEAQAKEIQQILSKSYNITAFAQVLGCSKPKILKSTQAIILISDGQFHATSLALETNLPVYLINRTITKIPEAKIKELQKKSKGAYINYLNSEKVGILVSTKPGQQNLARAIQLKKELNKKSYILIGNNLNPSQFENFGLRSYINTACPRLAFDNSKIVNMDDIKS